MDLGVTFLSQGLEIIKKMDYNEFIDDRMANMPLADVYSFFVSPCYSPIVSL
jgi:hypothetical protein